MSAANAVRTLKIKTGVVERTLKELLSYQKELVQNKNKVAEIRSGDDHSKLKQWENVLAETQGMIPDTASRLSNAVDDLKALTDNSLPEDAFEGTDELKRAEAVLVSAAQALEC